jgi:predicted 3-demethylubiquinone-9 3-methyltransferase (glyoxalase superfamily)
MARISPCLWFDGQAEEAANFYVSVFERSRILGVSHWGESGEGRQGSVLVAWFELDGQRFTALNGGPQFRFTEAVSLVVECEDQAQIDRYWSKLTADGGEESMCGWVKDRYGLSWQIVPAELPQLLDDEDPAARDRVMAAIMPMRKLDLAALRKAHAGR